MKFGGSLVVTLGFCATGRPPETKQWTLQQHVSRSRVSRRQHRLRGWVLMLAAVIVVGLAPGCGTIPHRNPVPQEFSASAEVPGIPLARMWGDEAPAYTDVWFASSKAELQARYSGIFGREHNYLAISGGGPNGAFGAGLLVGWTEAGTRPEFTMVTGISTGALIAPFAFLGAAYDGELQEAYTAYSTKDFFEKRLLLTALTSDAAVNTEPLKGLIAKYVDEEMLQTIAGEYRRGRQLFIGTTNLDAERPVIWNIGAIAVSGAPNALELFRKVVLASASIPAAFPPVFIEVEADGQLYDEMHVDGGGTSQVFLYPAGVDWGRVMERLEVKGVSSGYAIRNARLQPSWEAVEPRLFSIAARSISSLIRTQGIGDLYRIYLQTQRDGLDYNLAYIPDDVDLEPKEEFIDREYMQQLFDVGYRLAKAGYPWHKAPPGFEGP